MHYRIYSNTEPRHLVATVWGLELAEHTVDQLLTEFDGASVRFGAYGNPSLIPLPMVADIVERSYSHTGYFHDWHAMPVELARAYGRYFMASCEPHNLAFARNLGLRAFTVVSERPLDGAYGIECLATKAGLQCVECGLCDGTARSVSRSVPLPSVWIRAHGYQTEKAVSNLLN